MPTPFKPFSSARLWRLCLLLSILLHGSGLAPMRLPWPDDEDRLLKVRLVRPPKVRPPVMPGRFSLPGPEEQSAGPFAGLSPLPGQPEGLGELGASLTRPALPAFGRGPMVVPGALREFGISVKADTFALGPERMPSPTAAAPLGRGRAPRLEATDLLRLADMARANREHAAVMPDRTSRRDLRGYINFTNLQFYGMGSDINGGLDGLARYLRDHTGILAQVSPGYYEYFLDEQLLKDPVHFLLQDNRRYVEDAQLIRFSPEERELLRRYLRQGGFLFIEGEPLPVEGRGQYRFLREMVEELRAILGSQARFFPVPPSHPLYHSYYDFDAGFPGELGKQPAASLPGFADPVPDYHRPEALPPDPNIDPRLQQQAQAARERPAVGMWGVELAGQTVAVLSDLGLHSGWAMSAEDAGQDGSAEGLMAAINVVAYALNRSGGVAARLEQPAWRLERPRLALRDPDLRAGPSEDEVRSADEAGLYDPLDASLALVHSPLGSRIEKGGVRVMVDGRYSVELLKRGLHGVVLHNLPAGPHWLEVRYGGKTRQVEVALEGGKVTTALFGLDRLVFFTQLTVRPQKDVVEVQEWGKGFADLQLEEVYLGEDRKLLE